MIASSTGAATVAAGALAMAISCMFNRVYNEQFRHILQHTFSQSRTFNNEIKSEACNNVKPEIWSTMPESFGSVGRLAEGAGGSEPDAAGIASVARHLTEVGYRFGLRCTLSVCMYALRVFAYRVRANGLSRVAWRKDTVHRVYRERIRKRTKGGGYDFAYCH